MAGIFKILKAVVCILAVVSSAVSVDALGCTQVAQYLSPCIPYVMGQGPIGNCCGGVKGLYSAAGTSADRQDVCKCLKSMASNVDLDKAASLPSQCGVDVPYEISPSTDCAK
ncbi:non-specific lipid-transfer protein [Striga asiatica]|uniref:Non-specific lipid-transfer protein n=1 Tax=Striga asiatica TaxID=4170 RepID=A0A5A7QDJ6_STRAF|nr:non-specific lipid-transfer protein [Striga asiatica]